MRQNGALAFAELCGFVRAEMARLRIPGAALGMHLDGDVWVEGFGVTSVDHPQHVEGDTLFQVGSITKTYVGTAVMRLIAAGKIELDAPLRRYLPGLRLADASVADRVTMRHLLTHTAGWFGDYFGTDHRGEDASAVYVGEMVEYCPQVAALGELYSYCNSGFYLAGRVIELVTGKRFDLAMRELVLEPMELKRSFFAPEDVMVHRFSVGHSEYDGVIKVATPWNLPRAAWPAGGIVSSVRDQLKYAAAHMTDSSLKEMQSPLVEAAGHPDARVGLAWHVRDYGTLRTIGHGGGTNGQLTTLNVVPERKFAISMLTNLGSGGGILGDTVKLALKRLFEVDDPEPGHIAVDRDALGEYVGLYTSPINDIELSLGDDGLMMKSTFKGGFPFRDSPAREPPPPTRLAFYAPDRLIALDGGFKGGRYEVIRDDDARIKYLRAGRLRVRAR